MQISPNLKLAPDGKYESIEIGYDIAGKYYTITKNEVEIKDGVFVQADKKIMLTVENAKQLRDDLISFFGYHEKCE